MKKILILFAHPAYQKSRVNKRLVHDIDRISGVTFHDLYESYPELEIDIKAEQRLLLAHDIIVFHHPFFWYSVPAILKEWLDLVLEHGWAYGSEGTALQGKWFFSAITTGGRKEAYCAKGHNRFTIRQLLAPIEQSTYLCNMHFLPPFVVHGTYSLTPREIDEQTALYHRLLGDLVQERVERKALERLDYLNEYS